MPKLALNVLDNELNQAAAFARSKGLGLEVATFAFPENLEQHDADLMARHIRALEGITPVASHGPFLDLAATSRDPAIVAICEQRHRRSLEATFQLKATIYVAHTNFNPLIRQEGYRRDFTRRLCDFWLPLADVAGQHEVTIVLENLWEEGPEIQQQVVDMANHPHLRASFDNGHALVFSRRSASDWIKALGDSLVHLHLHDNNGEQDEHLPVGQGIENWSGLLEAVLRYAPKALLVAESDKLESNRSSIRRLQRELARLAASAK